MVKIISTRTRSSLALRRVDYCASRGGGGTTLLADHFMVLLPPPSVTGRIDEYDEYDGCSDAKRTGGRRNRCLSSRPVEGVGADTEIETEHGVPVGGCSSPRSDGD
jgi:hypothetical protein